MAPRLRLVHAMLAMLYLLTATAVVAAASIRSVSVSTWSFRSLNGSITLSNVTTPGTSHTHLLDKRVLTDDPYRRFNERELQWVAHTTWVYETVLPSDLPSANSDARVVFSCIDGIAHVTLNGEALGAPAANAFHPHVFPLPQRLRRGDGHDTLRVVFTPALEYAAQAAAAYPYDVPATRNFNVWAEPSHRPFVRKAGSDFGWDWGPAFVTTGITGDVVVEWIDSTTNQPTVILEDLDVVYTIATSLSHASVVRGNVSVRLDSTDPSHAVAVQLFINSEPYGAPVIVATYETTGDHIDAFPLVSTRVELPFELTDVNLWWPAGYGDPHLYNVSIEVRDQADSDVYQQLASLSHFVGFRTIELVQHPTSAGGIDGATFFFRVNGVDVFMKGANWIPNDSFPTRVTPAKVDFLLHSALAANMNMLRVWGGGRYESDAFYTACDRLGLLVWHEFMFACAMYPRDSAFLKQVDVEVSYQTRRLRKYTSVAIWGGNNENENMMASFANGDFMPPGEVFNRDVFVADFTELFVNHVRPLVRALDSSRPFVDTSPSNGLISEDPYVKRWGANTNDVAFGDVHYYNYSGDCQDPHMYPHARFVSEFGFQSMPSLQSLIDISDTTDWTSFHAFWTLLKFRERHENGTTQMASQLSRRFHVPFPFLDESWLETPLTDDFAIDVKRRVAAYVYLTQIQQALCYQTAIEAWRRGRDQSLGGTMGILYWQLNDVWQGTSWSSIEYSGQWKSLHYAIKRAYAPVLITVHADGPELVVYGVSDSKEDSVEFTVQYDVVDTLSGLTMYSVASNTSTVIPPLSSQQIDRRSIDSVLQSTNCSTLTCFLRVQPTTKLADGVDPAYHFFAAFKDLHLRHGLVTIDRVLASDSVTFEVHVTCHDFVALFVEVSTPSILGFWDHNTFHMMGNETRTLHFQSTSPVSLEEFSHDLQVRWLQNTYETQATVTVE